MSRIQISHAAWPRLQLRQARNALMHSLSATWQSRLCAR